MTVNPALSRFAAFEGPETYLAECSQGRKMDGRKWGQSFTSLTVFYLSVHPWRPLDCLEQQKRDWKARWRAVGTDKELCGHPQTKQKAERTSLQVNIGEQLAGPETS